MEPSELKRSCSNMTDKELEEFTAINEQNYEICKSILENRFAKKNNTFVFLIGTTHDQSELGFMLFIDSFFKNNKHVIFLTENTNPFSPKTVVMEDPVYSMIQTIIELWLVLLDPYCRYMVCHGEECKNYTIEETYTFLIKELIIKFEQLDIKDLIFNKDNWVLAKEYPNEDTLDLIRADMIGIISQFTEMNLGLSKSEWDELLQKTNKIVEQGLCRDNPYVVFEILEKFIVNKRDEHFIKVINNEISKAPQNHIIIVQTGSGHLKGIKSSLESQPNIKMEVYLLTDLRDPRIPYKTISLEPLIRRINEKVIEYGYITLG